MDCRHPTAPKEETKPLLLGLNPEQFLKEVWHDGHGEQGTVAQEMPHAEVEEADPKRHLILKIIHAVPCPRGNPSHVARFEHELIPRYSRQGR
eukprot:scaffold614_cov255-Pinguiococcus_pyrenoidosus.AAC.4